MAGLEQLNSFVGKFISLWKLGIDASLEINSNAAGDARVTIQAGIGQAQQLHHPVPREQRVPGPARLRRRQRREDARKANAEQAKQEEAVEETDKEVCEVEPQLVEETTDENLGSKADKTEIVTSDATSDVSKIEAKVDEHSAVKAFIVNDEVCKDSEYDEKQSEKETELFEVQVKAGQIVTNLGEVIMEVRPQYCQFSSQGLAEKLKKMNLELTCLPWVANTGRLFYTAGFKITEESYQEFRTRNEGNMPNGFYMVQMSRKLN